MLEEKSTIQGKKLYHSHYEQLAPWLNELATSPLARWATEVDITIKITSGISGHKHVLRLKGTQGDDQDE